MPTKNNRSRRHRQSRPAQEAQGANHHTHLPLIPSSKLSLAAKRLDVPPPSERISPGDDFYSYVNQTWLNHVHMPSYLASFGINEELEETIDSLLFDIARICTEKARQGKPVTNDHERMEDAVGRLVMSSMRPEVQQQNIEFAKRGIRSLSCMRDTNDIAKMFGSMLRYEIPTLFSIDVVYKQSHGKPTPYIQLGAGSLGLPDARYYNPEETALQSTKVLKEYSDVLHTVSKLFDLDTDLASGISVESSIAETLYKAKQDTAEEIYTFSELIRKFPKIPWDVLFKSIGFSHHPTTPIIINPPKWIRYMESLFESIPLEHWYLLLAIHTTLHAMGYLPAPFDTLYFSLFEKGLQGIQKKPPQHMLTLEILKTSMSEYMSYLYVKKYLTAKEKGNAEALARSLLDSAERHLKRNDWLEGKTITRAVEKVRRMQLSVFFKEPVTPLTKVPDLQTDILLANIYLLNGSKTDGWIQDLSKKINPFKVWNTPAYTVNAYYYSDLNQLLLPAGYFKWPMYDPRRIGWSYGGIGAIIGHEIIHAFDDDGMEINEKGDAAPFWTAKDRERYKQRLDELIRFFNQAKVAGMYVNGKLTASENLADLGGLAVALDACKQALQSKTLSAAQRAQELRDFFIGYAVSWRTKVREKKSIQSLYTDRHAPPLYRVNFIVCHFDEWYEAFQVKVKDKLYIPPEERIRIF
jgi:putative endopeptidase